MIPSIFFAIGRLVFGVMERRDARFVIAESSACLAFLALAVPSLRIADPILSGTVLGSIFALSAFLPRLLLPKHPIESPPIDDGAKTWVVGLGIVDFTWLLLMGASLAFVTFARVTAPFAGPTPASGRTSEFYTEWSENARFFLAHTFDGFFSLGTVLIATCALLWTGEFWRSRDSKHRRTYHGATIASMKMILAFFLCGFAVLTWIAWPLYQKVNAVAILVP